MPVPFASFRDLLRFSVLAMGAGSSVAAYALSLAVKAQTVSSQPITADPGSATSVVCSGSQCTIYAGVNRGNSLYHSFETFNIPEGWAAIFNGSSTPNVTNIFGRILTEQSTLNGTLTTAGFNIPPGVYLVNPFGFVLGTGFSANLPTLALAAADQMLLQPSGNTSGQYMGYGSSTDWSSLTSSAASSYWSSLQFAGVDSSSLVSKAIRVDSVDLAIPQLALMGSTVDFAPTSSLLVKNLYVFSQWFSGALIADGILDGGQALSINVRPGTVSASGYYGGLIFTDNYSIALINGTTSTGNMLLTRDSLYAPTSVPQLAYGSVRFNGAIGAYPLAVGPLADDQAFAGVLAKSAYIGVQNVHNSLTSPFGLNAGIRSAAPLSDYSYSLYYGFGSAIAIDPALYSDRTIEVQPSPSDTPVGRTIDSQQTPAELLIRTATGRMDSALSPATTGAPLVTTEETVRVQDGIQPLLSLSPDVTELSSSSVIASFPGQEQNSVADAASTLGLGSARALTVEDARGYLRRAIASVRGGGKGQIALRSGSFNAKAFAFDRQAYTPVIVSIRFTPAVGRTIGSNTDAFLDLVLIPADGEVVGKRVEVNTSAFAGSLKRFYSQLSRQEDLDVVNPASPSRQLFSRLIAPLLPEFQSRRVTTVLIAAERGLQGVPFAALHSGSQYLGEQFAFSLTPSLSLTNLEPASAQPGRLLAAGASTFTGLAPLPLVPQEIGSIASSQASDEVLDAAFTPDTLETVGADSKYDRIHLATHAEFLPGGPSRSRLYSGKGPVPMANFVSFRQKRQDTPLDLISLSACRTALGDSDSELGFAGLALQAGARSAIGTLWYVDDVATSAYFIQAYRYIQAGIPKAEALQFTRRDFADGRVALVGDRVVGPDGVALLKSLTSAQQRRIATGLANPYFWAGIELLGSPW